MTIFRIVLLGIFLTGTGTTASAQEELNFDIGSTAFCMQEAITDGERRQCIGALVNACTMRLTGEQVIDLESVTRDY